ncbi:MAG: hypothetical protein AB1644_05780 [Candidatus Zixiibacteriota bacterium]
MKPEESIIVQSCRSLRWSLVVAYVLTATSAYSDSTDIKLIAKDAAGADSSRFIVRIERVDIVNRRINDTLDITLESFDTPVAGFDFKIAGNDPSVDIVSVLPGIVYDSCQWDYFSAKRINTFDKAGWPLVLWHVVGLARAMPGASKPICFGFDREAPIIRLVVSNEHVLQMPETETAIFFFWEKCTDNVVSGMSGTKLSVSNNVLDYFPVDLPSPENLFPTRKGTPSQCINLSRPNHPLRQIEFHNGGLSFKYQSLHQLKDSVSTPVTRDSTGDTASSK